MYPCFFLQGSLPCGCLTSNPAADLCLPHQLVCKIVKLYLRDKNREYPDAKGNDKHHTEYNDCRIDISLPLFVPHDFIDPFHFLPHFCARFLRITSLCQVRADTNLAIEKFYFSIFLLPALLSEQCSHGLYDLIADDGKIGCKET